MRSTSDSASLQSSLVSELINARTRPAVVGGATPEMAASDRAFAAAQAQESAPANARLEVES